MTLLLTGAAVFLLANLAVGMLRVYLGPTDADRMLSVLLFGTTTVAVLLILAELMDTPALRDTALLFAMLAAILSVAFVSFRDEDERQ